MKRLIPFALIAVLLCGCPEVKLPKPTPMVPEPKAAPGEVKPQALYQAGSATQL